MIVENLLIKKYQNGDIHIINLKEDSVAKIDDISILYVVNNLVKKKSFSMLSEEEKDLFYFLKKEMSFSIKEGEGSIDIREGDLDELDFILTENCNLNCKHCYLECGNKSNSNYIPFNIIKDVIKDAKKLGVYKVILSGGEPFLYPNFKELVKFLNLENFHINVISNGLLIDEYIEFFKDVKGIFFTISLDGFREAHEFLRGKGTFEKTISNIKLLLKEGFSIGVNTVLYEGNVKTIHQFEDFIRELGVSDLTYQVLRLKGRGKRLEKYIVNDINLIQKIHICDIMEEKVKEEKSIKFCNAFSRSLTINYNGEVFGCESLGYSVGNVLYEKLPDIYYKGIKKNPILEVIENFEKTECFKCSLFGNLCMGGCRARALKATGNIYGCDLWIRFLKDPKDFENYPVWNLPVI